jgi:hypothetical protein
MLPSSALEPTAISARRLLAVSSLLRSSAAAQREVSPKIELYSPFIQYCVQNYFFFPLSFSPNYPAKI